MDISLIAKSANCGRKITSGGATSHCGLTVASDELFLLEIEKYLAREAISRAELAVLIDVSLGTVNKVLGRLVKPSLRFKLKASEKLGIIIPEIASAKFNFQLPDYKRQDVTHLEGRYQTIRPSYREDGALSGFVTVISWNEGYRCLTFHEEGNDLSPKNSGLVSIPLYNRMMYLLSCDRGNFRLSILSDAYEDGIFYGGLLTVSSQRMVEKMPTAAIYVLMRMKEGDKPVNGLILPNHSRFSEFNDRVEFGREEGFFRSLA